MFNNLLLVIRCHRLILVALEFLKKRFLDAEFARIKHVLAFLVVQRASLVCCVLVVVDHVLQRIRYVEQGQVASVTTMK